MQSIHVSYGGNLEEFDNRMPHHSVFYYYKHDHTMAQAVSRRPLTAEDRVHARVIPCGICGG
jgi:hypothetical protein